MRGFIAPNFTLMMDSPEHFFSRNFCVMCKRSVTEGFPLSASANFLLFLFFCVHTHTHTYRFIEIIKTWPQDHSGPRCKHACTDRPVRVTGYDDGPGELNVLHSHTVKTRHSERKYDPPFHYCPDVFAAEYLRGIIRAMTPST